jgi:zinc/manganese transport system substrate-binding protein
MAARSINRRPPSGRIGSWIACCVVASGLAACSTSTASPAPTVHTGKVSVVAAENFWGSIVSQIGGAHVDVTSIITNPNTDPHSYEPSASDARIMAQAQFVVENGVGYDPWVSKLLAGNQEHPKVLDVGTAVGAQPGDNPHRWYNPADVQVVIGQVVHDLSALDAAEGAYFAAQARKFTTVALAPYNALIAAIKARFADTPVGASESIVSMLAPSLGLDVITPPTFLRAISEGEDVTVADKETIDNQITHHLFRIYIYNSQNVTPDVQAQLNEAKAEHIPVATITETLQPASSSYQAWQIKELLGIQAALVKSSAA